MKTSFIIVCIASICAADVAHLGRNYLPPDRERSPLSQTKFSGSKSSSFTAGTCFSERLTQAAPTKNYIAPAASLTGRNSASTFNTFERLTLPANPNFQRPFVQSLNTQNLPKLVAATAPAQAQRLTNALPSSQYLSPEIEAVEPIAVQQSYSAPVISYNSPASSPSSSAYTAGASQSDTKYSADGGYVY